MTVLLLFFHKLLAHGQLLLVALINLNPVQRVHGLQPHRHLVLALHKNMIWQRKARRNLPSKQACTGSKELLARAASSHQA